MRSITSTNNDRIRFLKTLKTKKGRRESGTFLLEGKRAVLDALSHGVSFECLLTCGDFSVEADCERFDVPMHLIEALSETSSPEGIIAQARMPDVRFRADRVEGNVIFLDHLQDAGNLGTIIRTVDAARAGTVVLSEECVELFNPKTVRATMGSIFNVNVLEAENGVQALRELKAKGYTVCTADFGGEDFFAASGFSPDRTALVIGNEGNGVSPEVKALADRVLTLPMRGGAESLNASVAAAIMIYGIVFTK